jgi:alpha-mannosidase
MVIPSQDWGHHEFVLGLVGYRGDWRGATTIWQAYRLNDPLIAFTTIRHPGSLGNNFSLLHLNDSRIRVLAVKKAEESDEIVIRMVELDGPAARDVHVEFATPITGAREVNAQEQAVGSAEVRDGALVTSFAPYQPRTFALRLGPPRAPLELPHSQRVELNYDLAVASNDDTKTEGGGMDGNGNAIPAEMLPVQIDYGSVKFQLAAAKTGVPNALIAKDQTLALPSGRYNRVYLLAASAARDQKAVFRVGDRPTELNIQSWTGWIGQWDTRIWKNEPERDWAISANHAVWPPPDVQEKEARAPSPRFPEDHVGLKPGFVKPATLAWYCSHHHTTNGLNEPYQYSYLFAYSIDIPLGSRTLTLPDNHKIRILALSVAEDDPSLSAATPLYDTLNRSAP